MSFSRELLQHAIWLVSDLPQAEVERPILVDIRRSISAAYYALFHRLSEAVVAQIAPSVQAPTANRIHRWVNHSEMKRICQEFASPQLRQPLRNLLDTAVSRDMQVVAINFIRLQEARHNADYDIAFEVSRFEALEFIALAVSAIDAWERIERTPEGNIFILSLVLWRNWEKER